MGPARPHLRIACVVLCRAQALRHFEAVAADLVPMQRDADFDVGASLAASERALVPARWSDSRAGRGRHPNMSRSQQD